MNLYVKNWISTKKSPVFKKYIHRSPVLWDFFFKILCQKYRLQMISPQEMIFQNFLFTGRSVSSTPTLCTHGCSKFTLMFRKCLLAFRICIFQIYLKHCGLKFVSSRYRKICFKEEEVYYVKRVKEGGKIHSSSWLRTKR